MKEKVSKQRANEYDQKLAINTDFDSAVKVMFKDADKKQARRKE